MFAGLFQVFRVRYEEQSEFGTEFHCKRHTSNITLRDGKGLLEHEQHPSSTGFPFSMSREHGFCTSWQCAPRLDSLRQRLGYCTFFTCSRRYIAEAEGNQSGVMGVAGTFSQSRRTPLVKLIRV